MNHGAAAAPDGSRLYFTNEAEHTLDFVDAKTLKVTKRVPLSGRPNNVSISKDGRRVYVAIAQAPGAVDVIDTASQTLAKTIPIEGAGHNTYVTPDGKFVVAGSVAGRTLTAIDSKTEEISWVMKFNGGVRPITFETNPDGSTKRMFVQISDFHGFAVVDFATHQAGSARGDQEHQRSGIAFSRHRHYARRQDVVGHQQVVPLCGSLFDAGPQAPWHRPGRPPPRLAHVQPGQQDRLCGVCGFESRQRG